MFVEELFESSPVLRQLAMEWVGDIAQEIINENLAAWRIHTMTYKLLYVIKLPQEQK